MFSGRLASLVSPHPFSTAQGATGDLRVAYTGEHVLAAKGAADHRRTVALTTWTRKRGDHRTLPDVLGPTLLPIGSTAAAPNPPWTLNYRILNNMPSHKIATAFTFRPRDKVSRPRRCVQGPVDRKPQMSSRSRWTRLWTHDHIVQ